MSATFISKTFSPKTIQIINPAKLINLLFCSKMGQSVKHWSTILLSTILQVFPVTPTPTSLTFVLFLVSRILVHSFRKKSFFPMVFFQFLPDFCYFIVCYKSEKCSWCCTELRSVQNANRNCRPGTCRIRYEMQSADCRLSTKRRLSFVKKYSIECHFITYLLSRNHFYAVIFHEHLK